MVWRDSVVAAAPGAMLHQAQQVFTIRVHKTTPGAQQRQQDTLQMCHSVGNSGVCHAPTAQLAWWIQVLRCGPVWCYGCVQQDAPYKKRGMIPYGVQRGSYGLTAEEKMRRRWREWSAAGSSANGSGSPALAAAAGDPSYQVRQLTDLQEDSCR